MTTYTVHFHTDVHWAESDIDADTPELALEAARRLADNEAWTPNFQSYDGTDDIEEIAVLDPSGQRVAQWQLADLMLRLAAGDLLEALEMQTDAAQAVIDSWAGGDLADAVRTLDASIEGARAVIAQAKGAAS